MAQTRIVVLIFFQPEVHNQRMSIDVSGGGQGEDLERSLTCIHVGDVHQSSSILGDRQPRIEPGSKAGSNPTRQWQDMKIGKLCPFLCEL